ncbi:MAG: phage holin family protein [Lachnospiraceae bacterium]|nr:phage holin family protein [Lachnospiraceae bacterium]
MEQLNPELLILVPVLNGIGYAAKKMGLNPKFIPALLIFIGAAIASLYMENHYFGITQGILAALAATGFHQNCKQIKTNKHDSGE